MLKFEHLIYNKDFESEKIFKEIYEDKIHKLEMIREQLKAIQNKDWECFSNHKLSKNFIDIVDETLYKTEILLKSIEDAERNLKR